jgi:hypothetical protein
MNHRFYVKHSDQWKSVEEFSLMMLELADIEFCQPAPVSAPWHWQAFVNGATFNFWPHLNKWNIESEKARYGWRNAKQAIIAYERADPLDLFMEDE